MSKTYSAMSTMTNYNTCPKCSQEILETDEKFMLGIDRPYYNIWFHRNCFKSIPYGEELKLLLLNTVNLWYNISINQKIMRKNRK